MNIRGKLAAWMNIPVEQKVGRGYSFPTLVADDCAALVGDIYPRPSFPRRCLRLSAMTENVMTPTPHREKGFILIHIGANGTLGVRAPCLNRQFGASHYGWSGRVQRLGSFLRA